MSPKLPGSLAVVVLTAAVAFAAPGAAQARSVPGGGSAVSAVAQLSPEVARTVTGTGVEARQRALAEYWTPARMRAAKPESEIPAVQAARAAGQSGQRASQPQGPAGTIAPAAPAAEPSIAGYPVGHPVARTTGKVFLTLNGSNYTCMGTIVNTEGKSAVWTAGHCVIWGGLWATNWMFVPNWNGSAPYGYWYPTRLFTTPANDVGAAVMAPNNGWRICDYLGGQGIAWNRGLPADVYVFGYYASELVAGRSPAYGGGSDYYVVVFMPTGTLLGPWLIEFDGNWGLLNGYSAGRSGTCPQCVYSPYYGNQVANLYNAIRYLSS
ncbi:trypsin-like serine peptidase [Micromonospora sp. NPDC048830]|uniref:trypsin-like serine peptidase n=1 Tax=Micromonospora sp. NPDC048830 TaxID=3364257 RepID=UPI003716D86C